MYDRRELASTLGKRIRAARARLGLSQEQTAEKLGICLGYYGRLERGHALPSVTILRRLSTVLETAADELLGLAIPG